MISKTARADLLMLLTAAVWGFGFVAQRAGMEHVGPFTFNGVRFALGGVSLIPFLFIRAPRRKFTQSNSEAAQSRGTDASGASGTDGGPAGGTQDDSEAVQSRDAGARPAGAKSAGLTEGPVRTRRIILSGLLAGTVLFLAASFQQVGLLTTTAGNAGFITGLYVIIVPILGLLFRHRAGTGVWIGALLAVVGLYFLSSVEGLMMSRGDFLEVICAVLFAVHVLLIGWLSPKTPAVPLSIVQFLVCSLFCLIVAFVRETIVIEDILSAAVPILYGGLGSVGIAYTLQVIGQKDAPPGHAAIILSLESAFAFFGGWLLLSEPVTARTLFGASLILTGMLVAQIQKIMINRKNATP